MAQNGLMLELAKVRATGEHHDIVDHYNGREKRLIQIVRRHKSSPFPVDFRAYA
jgi:hypothetical protein